MPTSPMSKVMQRLRRAALLRDGAGLTDGQLLECYISRGEEAAIAALVRRHGPMIWGVCRRVLRNYHDAEDAFQATFLVLVRKAASIVPREKVANWLYGVAHQTALKARATAARRKGRERQVAEMPEPSVTEQELWRDLQPLLDEELSRLPEKHRVVIVLCDLEGKTRKEAARQLGVPEGTVAGQLARARAMLAKRLTQRGVVLSGASLAVLLSEYAASACVPSSVVSSTIKAVSLLTAGQAAATGMISVKVAALTEGVVKIMLLNKLKWATAAVLMIFAVSVIAGVGVSAFPAWGQDHKQRVESKAPHPLPAKDKNENTKQGRIFFVRQKGVGEVSLAMVNPDGKEEASLTKNHKPKQQPGFHAASPDGQKIAYGVHREDPDNDEVFLKTVGDEKPGESLKLQGTCWCWSPDGRSLAITSLKDNVLSHEIFDFKTKKTKPLQLPEVKAPEDAEGPVGHVITDWSKDGKWLLTTCFMGWKKADLYRVKSDGSEAKRIGQGMCGKFSPDGKKILYLGGWKDDDETPEKGQLFVADVDGGKPQRVSQELNGKFTGGFCWSPDGKKIAYVWQRDRDAESQEWETFLMVMDADGKNSTTVLSEKLTSTHNYVSFLHPDWR